MLSVLIRVLQMVSLLFLSTLALRAFLQSLDNIGRLCIPTGIPRLRIHKTSGSRPTMVTMEKQAD